MNSQSSTDKQITVTHLPYGEELHVRIPVRYRIEKLNEYAMDLHCSIDLPENDRPDWLHLREFTISKTCTTNHPKVVGILYSKIPLGSLKEAGLPEAIDVHIRLSDPEYRNWAGEIF